MYLKKTDLNSFETSQNVTWKFYKRISDNAEYNIFTKVILWFKQVKEQNNEMWSIKEIYLINIKKSSD